MLTTYPVASDDSANFKAGTFWVDLFNPTPAEAARVTAECGIEIPSRESL